MIASLELKDVQARYGLIQAVRGASFAVRRGSVTGLLGNNGAGKSTLLKTVMGLIPGQPQKGEILLDGKRINGMDTESIVRLGVSYVPENRAVFHELSVQDNLIMGAHIRKDRRALKTDLERIYAFFPILADRINQPAGTLSGGEQQMLAISRAMMSRPRLLLLDEPSLGLSPFLVRKIFQIIRIIRNQGVTILLVEQNVRKALAISDYAVVMESGRLVSAGPSADLKNDPRIKEFYLGLNFRETQEPPC
ncbi:ABC transporter ATP-binding protein [Desulfatibacillum aliphaticivorans]|uniref:ABC transporter ATP-binding protein n=1 Tax=Desulfatibacillum aliphaticivorans TaxID=218208 RepID=UPI000410E4DF|nr:ABC transporter ATP-binding protein [Desulfatibacillum aliphaticivorans]